MCFGHFNWRLFLSIKYVSDDLDFSLSFGVTCVHRRLPMYTSSPVCDHWPTYSTVGRQRVGVTSNSRQYLLLYISNHCCILNTASDARIGIYLLALFVQWLILSPMVEKHIHVHICCVACKGFWVLRHRGGINGPLLQAGTCISKELILFPKHTPTCICTYYFHITIPPLNSTEKKHNCT